MRKMMPTFLLLLYCCPWITNEASAQEDKFEGLILIPAALKGSIDWMPKSLPFVGAVLNCPAKVVVGGLDAVKKEPDVRFILQVHSVAYFPAKGFAQRDVTRLDYSVYYRPADPKKTPVLLAKRTTELNSANPKTDRTVFGTMAWCVGDDLADVLAPKILDAKPVPYLQTLDTGGVAKRNAFLVTYAKDDKGEWRGRVTINNRLPVKVEIAKLAFVPQPFVTGKQPADRPSTFVEFKKWIGAAPKVTTEAGWPHNNNIIGPESRYVRIVGLQLYEP